MPAKWHSTVFVCAAIFVPGHLLGWLVEWVWLGITLAAGTMILLNTPNAGGFVGLSRGLWLGLNGLLLLASVTTLVVAVTVWHIPIDHRDIAELLRLPIYGTIGLILAALALNWSISGIDLTLRVMIIFIIISSAVYIFKIPYIYQLYSEIIYIGSKTVADFGVIRISIPFANPNFLGFFLLLVATYFMFYNKNGIYSILILLCLFLTGSRSAWIAVIPIILLWIIYNLYVYSTQKIGYRSIIVLSSPFIFMAIIVTYWDQLQYFSRFAELSAALQGDGVANVRTAKTRLSEATRLLDWYEISPVSGLGPGRALELDVADNQYISWLLSWGIIGTTFILVIYVMLFGRLIFTAKRMDHIFGSIGLSTSIALIIFTGDFLENYRLYFLMCVMLQTFYHIHTQSSLPGNAPKRLDDSYQRNPKQKSQD